MQRWVPVGCSRCCLAEFLHRRWLWDGSSEQDVLLLQTWPRVGGAAGNCLYLLVGKVLLLGPPRVRVSELWARAGRTCPEQGVGWSTRHGALVLREGWGGLSQTGPGGVLGLPEEECYESPSEWGRALARSRDTSGMVPFLPIAPTADVHGIAVCFTGQHPAWVRGDGCMGQRCPFRSTRMGCTVQRCPCRSTKGEWGLQASRSAKDREGCTSPWCCWCIHARGAVLLSPGSTSPCLCAQLFFSALCSGSCRQWGLGKRHLNHVAFSLAHLLLTRNRREPSVGSVATFHPAAACHAQVPFSEEQQKAITQKAQPKTHRDVFPYGTVGGKMWGFLFI